jgi:tRNA(Ser,Leu) C12 N-acetylase TAN1
MKVDDITGMLETLRDLVTDDSRALPFLSRLIPVTEAFTFQSPEEFKSRAREMVLAWADKLRGKSFHVRILRRGFRRKLSSPEKERLLDAALLESLEKAGSHGRITFDDPDAVIAIETVGQRAGLSYWTREDLQRYPFIRLD